jgi:four helix bundle protein
MTEIQNTKHKYDLEERLFIFAKNTRLLVKQLNKTSSNIEDGKQLIRSSGSAGANYIEANEALSKKDFLMRIKICRKEAKESIYWLRLVDAGKIQSLEANCNRLIIEAGELTAIFGSIVRKSEK